jgi:prepilin-type N-terminal cleavage/methylation domain-containing protein
MKHFRKGGFTLVEIMIVISVIGIVVAIAAPTWLRQREITRGRSCQENLVKVSGAKEVYALEFKLSNGAPCTMQALYQPPGTTMPSGQGYMKAVVQCPSDGVYSVNAIGKDPTCSIGTSVLPFEPHLLPHLVQ